MLLSLSRTIPWTATYKGSFFYIDGDKTIAVQRSSLAIILTRGHVHDPLLALLFPRTQLAAVCWRRAGQKPTREPLAQFPRGPLSVIVYRWTTLGTTLVDGFACLDDMLVLPVRCPTGSVKHGLTSLSEPACIIYTAQGSLQDARQITALELGMPGGLLTATRENKHLEQTKQ